MRGDWPPWAVAVGAVLAFDAALIAGGHDSLTCRAERHPHTTGLLVALLACHLLGRPRALRPVDPLRLASHAIRHRKDLP